jgi:hypothetical protein
MGLWKAVANKRKGIRTGAWVQAQYDWQCASFKPARTPSMVGHILFVIAMH